MYYSDTGKEADISEAERRSESVGLIELLVVQDGLPLRAGLTDVAAKLAAPSASLRGSLRPGQLVRAISYYCGNLMDARDIQPADIESLIKNEYSADALPRSEVAVLLGISGHQGQCITSACTDREVLTPKSSRATLRVLFPAELASRCMP